MTRFIFAMLAVGLAGCTRQYPVLNGLTIQPETLIDLATDTGFSVTCHVEKGSEYTRNCRLVQLPPPTVTEFSEHTHLGAGSSGSLVAPLSTTVPDSIVIPSGRESHHSMPLEDPKPTRTK